MKLKQCEAAMCKAYQESCHAQVPAVVEQRQKPLIQSCERPDTQYNMQQQERRRSESTNQQSFRSRGGISQDADA